MAYQPDDDPDFDDPEAPDPSDLDPDPFSETEPCPNCGKPVYEHAQICHHCGKYIGLQDSPRPKPLWLILAAVGTVVGIIVLWVIYG